MAYANATFFIDYEGGSDAARTALTSVAVANNGAGLVRCTKAAHGLVSGAVVDVTLNYAGAWIVTVIDASNFDLVGSTYSTATAATVTPRGGSSLADAWKTVTSGATAARIAAGDTMRIKASPDPTSLGTTGAWTDGPLKATVPIASSSNTSPIVITLTSGNWTTLAPVVGDTVIVSGHLTNLNANGVWTVSATNGSTTLSLVDAAGANSVGIAAGSTFGTVRKINNAVVTLGAALTKNIALCGNQGQKTLWTASANVTASALTTDFKEGGESQQFSVAAAFTTGLAAYFPTGTLDLSSYQQVSLWVKPSSTISANAVSIKLCSDAAGATPVHSLNLPATSQLFTWNPVVVDFGGALSASIQSIALYINTDSGAQTLGLDNIIACKASSSADSLNLTSLISKNTGTEAWFAIQSINGTRVMLDALANTIPNSTPQRGYAGATETVTTYKRETVKTAMVATSSVSQAAQKSGTLGNRISYSGGWDRTAMTTQSGETWWDGQNGAGVGLGDNAVALSYLAFDKLNFVRYNIGYQLQNASSAALIGSMAASSCTTPMSMGGFTTASTVTAVNFTSALVTGNSSVIGTVARCDSGNGINTGANSTVGTITQANNNSGNCVVSGINSTIGTILAAHGNVSAGYVAGSNSTCGSLTANNNGTYAISFGVASEGAKILGGSSTGNVSGAVVSSGSTGLLRNFTAAEVTPFSISSTWVAGVIRAEKNNGVTDAHVHTFDGGTIVSATDQRNTASGISWKFRPTVTARGALYPLPLPLAKVACAAGVAVNVTVYTRRDNVNIIGTLKIYGGQIAGVPNDVAVDCQPTINTWVQSGALTFTPTEAGVVAIVFEVYDGIGTTNSFWVDDLAVS